MSAPVALSLAVGPRAWHRSYDMFSRCTEKEIECTYSKRRPRTCTTYRTRRMRTLESADGASRHSGAAEMALIKRSVSFGMAWLIN